MQDSGPAGLPGRPQSSTGSVKIPRRNELQTLVLDSWILSVQVTHCFPVLAWAVELEAATVQPITISYGLADHAKLFNSCRSTILCFYLGQQAQGQGNQVEFCFSSHGLLNVSKSPSMTAWEIGDPRGSIRSHPLHSFPLPSPGWNTCKRS
jgi:hypothetical protein